MESKESLKTRLMRWKFNFFPAFRGTGGRITHIAADMREIRIEVPLSWRTKNYVGTIYGGSMYGAVDPIHMVMLIILLGRDYIVWDKVATIRFRKPGRMTLFATVRIEDEELDAIRAAVANGPIDRTYTVDLVDAEGVPHATIEKTIYIRKK